MHKPSIRRFSSLIGAITLIYFCFLPARAQDFQLLRAAYDAGDSQATARLAHDIIAAQPNNALAHYYLADALVKIGEVEHARLEYKQVIALSGNNSLAQHATRALALIAPRKETVYSPDLQLQKNIEGERKRLMSQEEEEKQQARKRFDDRVKAAGNGMAKDAFDQLDEEEERITARYRKRIDALVAHPESTRTSGSGALKTTMGSQGNVQSYQNFGDESKAATIPTENPLSARALRLGEKLTTAPKTKPKTK